MFEGSANAFYGPAWVIVAKNYIIIFLRHAKTLMPLGVNIFAVSPHTNWDHHAARSLIE
jgi:hypothetical protein